VEPPAAAATANDDGDDDPLSSSQLDNIDSVSPSRSHAADVRGMDARPSSFERTERKLPFNFLNFTIRKAK